jgi:hypothetical protein
VGAEFGEEQFGEARDGLEILAHLGALEVVGAVEAGAEDEVAFLQGARADEDVEDFLLKGFHEGRTVAGAREKTKSFCVRGAVGRTL